jgi:hypothetical protein
MWFAKSLLLDGRIGTSWTAMPKAGRVRVLEWTLEPLMRRVPHARSTGSMAMLLKHGGSIEPQ